MIPGYREGTAGIWRQTGDLGEAVLVSLRPGRLLLDELVAFESNIIVGPTFETLCV